MEELEKALTELINANPLPFEAKRYVIKHIKETMDWLYQIEMLKKKESEVKPDE